DDADYLERVRSMFRTTQPPGARGAGTANGRHRLRLPLDGAGFDNMDVPDGSPQPKLEFSVFVPSADLAAGTGPGRAQPATRRQNFLVPPRRHRAFPLLELALRH